MKDEHNPFVEVSQDTRDNARIPVARLIEKLEAESIQLCNAKRRLEDDFAAIETWRRDEINSILHSRLPTHISIEKTNKIELEAKKKRAPFKAELRAIEERLQAVKFRLGNAKQKRGASGGRREDQLDRIVELLEQIAARIVR